MAILKNFWTIETLSAELKVSKQTIYKWIHNGQLDAVLLDRYYVPQKSVDKFIDRQLGAKSKVGRKAEHEKVDRSLHGSLV